MKTLNLTCSKRKISSKPVILLILWNVLMLLHVNSIQYSGETVYLNINVEHRQSQYIFYSIALCLIFLSYPLFGLLADVKTGRYKTIIVGVHFSFLSWIITGLSCIIKTYLPEYDTLSLVAVSIAFILGLIGSCCFHSNVIQFSFDQVIGASADELSAIIYCYAVCMPLCYLLFEIGQCLFEQFFIMSYVVSGIAVSAILITNYLFKHWLDTIPHIVNPVKRISQVLNYARKNKYPRNRSALTYWEEDYPSRLDLGKDKYGGPFSEEQVEDVKTVLRLIPLLISVVGVECTGDLIISDFLLPNKTSQFILCCVNNDSLYFVVAVVLTLLYHFLIYPYFYKFIPSMLKRISLGLIIALLTTLYYVVMLACRESFNINSNSYKAFIAPQILHGISFAFIFPTSLEFTIAQCPHEMRGFLIGLWYAALRLGDLINISGKYPFNCQGEMHCQSLYYHVLKSVIILIILIIFLILAKCYKFRVREKEVNIHLIAEEHYERYLDQEDQYRREMGEHYERYLDQEDQYRREMGLSLESTD